jgi:hypothetical protein
MNSRCPDPRVYLPGDIVFARHATWLDAAKGPVGKLKHKFTGPWHVIESLKGASYAIKHCLKPSRKEKKHASDLTPYPSKLIPFKPVDGANNCYGQLYKPIGANPFKQAGLKVFKPPTPFCAPQNFINLGDHNDFQWPTLAELNNNLDPFPWHNEDKCCRYMCNDAPFAPPVLYMGPTPSLPAMNPPPDMPPTITSLSPRIINSINKLFFISHKIGNAATREWRLVRVAFCDTMSLYPSALQDGSFLVEFYVAHPNDVWYNATNQCFWLQYHKHTALTFGTIDAHLITLSVTLEERACATILSPFAVGLISPTVTPTFTAHLSLLWYVFAKPVIALARTIGMCSLQSPPYSLTRFPSSSYPHIPSMWIVAFIQFFTAWQLHLIVMTPCTRNHFQTICLP